MAIVLCLAAGLLPILIAPGALFYFDVTPKILVLLASAIAGLIVRLGKRSGVRGFFSWVIAAQAVALVMATAFSTHIALSFSGTEWRRFGMVTQLALLVFTSLAAGAMDRDRGTLEPLLRTVATTGGAIAIYATFQYFGLDPLIPPSSYRAGEGIFTIVRPPGTLGHANYLATYLLLVMFAGFALASVESGRGWRMAGAGCAIAAGLASLLTGSRSVALGLVAGIVWLFLRARPRIGRGAIYACAGIAIAVAALYVSPAGRGLRARVHWMGDDPRGGARLPLWRDAVRMAGGRLAFGYGPETFGAEFPRYQSLELARAYPDFYHESPHNIFLDALDEQGVFGLAGLVAITALGLSLAWKAREVPRVFVGGALAAMVVSLQFSAFTLPTAFFFYLAIGALVAGRAKPVSDAPSGAPGYAVAAIGLVLAGLFGWFGIRLGTAEYRLAGTQGAIGRGDPIAAIEDYETVRRWEPPGASSDLYYSRAMARYSAMEKNPLPAAQAGRQAMEAALRACNYPEQRQNEFYYLATLFAIQNDAVDTEKGLRAAIAVAPNWFKPHWTLAKLLQMTGRHAEAEREAEAAVERDGGKHKEVADTLVGIRAVGGAGK